MSADLAQELIEAADRLPSHLRDWLVVGFESWREGEDLAESLGLFRPTLDERDQWIKLCVSLCPGETDTAKCSFFLDCIAGSRQHPEAAGQRLIEKLISQPVNVELSIKQLRRIINGRRQDGWWLSGT